jgi:glycosyltransferase involved in cell wall biosynthesis
MISVVIPSRNEPYLKKTIESLFANATGEIEVIAVLDGYWIKPEEVVIDDRVRYIHFAKSRGMRNAINSGVAVARGEYILKCDAHVLFSKGFDEELVKNCEYDWVVVPRRYALDVNKWAIEERTDNKYPVDYMFLNKELHGEVWDAKNSLTRSYPAIDDLMSSQGSCWFMKKSYFEWLELMDEDFYGKFAWEFQEIGFKVWLSGGKVKVNKNVSYAHWHKTEGRGYSLAIDPPEITERVNRWRTEKVWHKQKYNLDYLWDKFPDRPNR